MSEEVKDPAKTDPEPSGLVNERDSIYEKFSQVLEPAAKEEKAEPEPEKKETAETPESVSTPEATPEKVEVKEEKKETEKTVPYDALHQEREKRKAAQSRIRELENQVSAIVADYKKLTEEKVKPEETEAITDYETEIVNLRKEVSALKQGFGQERQKRSEEESKKVFVELDTKIKNTASDLEKEGFPLFFEMQNEVSKEIVAMMNEDPDEASSVKAQWDTPEGWKKIYKERVYPKIEGKIKPKFVQEKNAEKTELKKQAGLVGTPGQKGGKAADKNEWTYNDYLSMRKERPGARR